MNLFKKTRVFQGMVQFDEKHEPCMCGTSVKWLEEIEVRSVFYNTGCRQALKILNDRYPEYRGLVQIY